MQRSGWADGRRRIRNGLIAAGIAGLGLAPAIAAAAGLPPDGYMPPQGTATPITIDGGAADWGTPPTAFFADMYRAGKPDKPVESKLYLRYDCTTQTLYALVQAQPGVTVITSNDDNFIKLGNSDKLVDGSSGNDGTPPDFSYIPAGAQGTADGWEAAVHLAPGTYAELNVHAQVDDGGSQTSAVAGRGIPLTLTCPGALTAAKTATPTFTRTYGWTLQKTATTPSPVTTTGDSATVGYTVTATRTGPTDSGWKVEGTISAANATDAPVQDVVITEDGVDNGTAACQVTGGTAQALLPGETLTATYVCTYSGPPAVAAGTNTATVSWTGDSPVTSVKAQAAFAFDTGAPGNPDVVNGSLTVNDTFAEFGGPRTVSQTTTWSYQRTFTGLQPGCQEVTNTASATPPLAPPASATVTICRETPPPPPSPPAPPVVPATPVSPAATPAGTPATPVTPATPAGTPTRTVTRRRAALAVAKRAPARATAGQVVPYTITVRNTGRATARGVRIVDRVPGRTSLVRAQGARLSAGNLTWAVGTLAPGQQRTVRLRLRLDTQAAGLSCNTAEATASNARRAVDRACTRVSPVASRVQPAVTG